jgi:DNA-binding MarR family transcriptional regulator
MLSNRIGRAFVDDLAAHGITVAEWRVLLSAAAHDAVSGQEVTNRWAMDKMAVNRAVANLEERHLIEKRANPDDRRAIDVVMTRSGRELHATLLPVANGRYHQIMAGLDRTEAATLRTILSKLIAHMDGDTM